MSTTLAIVGGGSAGVSALYQLVEFFLKHPLQERPRILLIEKSKEIGPGLAYSKTTNDMHLLNTVYSKISPIPGKLDHFAKWLKNPSNSTKWRPFFPKLDLEISEYLPRKLFGIYLADLALETQKRARSNGIEVEFMTDEVIDIKPKDNEPHRLEIKFEFHLNDEVVDSVVLCIGHLPPSQTMYQDFDSKKGYYKTPWEIKDDDIPVDKDFLVLGTRLTAIDAILARAEYIRKRIQDNYKGPIGKIIAVSHTGLLPRVLSDVTQSYVRKELTLEAIELVSAYGTQPVTLRTLKRLFRAEVRRAYKIIKDKDITFKIKDVIHKTCERNPTTLLEHEIDCAKRHVERPWQTVLFSLYPIVPRLWEALDDQGKQEFLDKYYSFWMTYLAAFPLINAEKILDLLKCGQLEIHSGLKSVSHDTQSGSFTLKMKDGTSFQGEHLVNATGQGHDITKTDSDLLKNLLKKGYIKPHALGGVDVDFRTLRVVSEKSDIPLFIIGDPTWGACMATADLAQIVSHQIPRVINSILNPLKSRYQASVLITKSSPIFTSSTGHRERFHLQSPEEQGLSTSPTSI